MWGKNRKGNRMSDLISIIKDGLSDLSFRTRILESAVDNLSVLTTDVTRCSECKYYIENTCAITNEPQQEEHFCSWGSGE